MNTPQSQIKVNLPVTMKDYLASKAAKFGIPLAGYIKHLILKDIEYMDYPTFQASEKVERTHKKALKEHRQGKTIKINNIDKFFAEL